jgi:hypothetical protein
MKDGALGAAIRPVSVYRSRRSGRWDTDPPRLFLRGRGAPRHGAAPSQPLRYLRRGRCSRWVRFDHGGARFDLLHSCAAAGGAPQRTMRLCGPGGRGTVLVKIEDQRLHRLATTWVGDWDGDGRLELLVEATRRGEGTPRYAAIFRVSAKGPAQLLGERSAGLLNLATQRPPRRLRQER